MAAFCQANAGLSARLAGGGRRIDIGINCQAGGVLADGDACQASGILVATAVGASDGDAIRTGGHISDAEGPYIIRSNGGNDRADRVDEIDGSIRQRRRCGAGRSCAGIDNATDTVAGNDQRNRQFEGAVADGRAAGATRVERDRACISAWSKSGGGVDANAETASVAIITTSNGRDNQPGGTATVARGSPGDGESATAGFAQRDDLSGRDGGSLRHSERNTGGIGL